MVPLKRVIVGWNNKQKNFWGKATSSGQFKHQTNQLFLFPKVAAENGQAAIVEYLIQNKADLNAQNNDGKSPIGK